MFNTYEIKIIDQEEVLYLYCNLNMEFGFLKKNSKKTSIQKEVKNYIRKNNIAFYGKKVVLVASGLIISTIILNTPNKNLEPTYKYISPITETINIEKPVIKDNNKESAKKPTELKSNSNSISTKAQTVIKKENNSKSPTTSNKNESITKDVKKNEIMVTVYRSNGSVLNIELEEYLIGVVAAEMPASFHIEALKAQAVAARTYALKAIKDNTKLTDTVSTQVYQNNNELKAKWKANFNTYYNKIKNAVSSTKGLAIYYNNTLINAFYHSTSNGYTEDSSYVFGEYPYLKSVESSLDKNASSYEKTTNFSYEQISKKLNISVTNLSTIVINRNASKRVSNIIIDTTSFDGVKFRSLLGLRSTDFDITLNENDVTITTRGYGHGVGMSQYGANFYANSGMSYQNILKHYYTGVIIK